MKRELLKNLHGIQEKSGANCLDRKALAELSEQLRINPSRIADMASFYTMFSFEPRGKHIIRVCENISCHLGGAAVLAKIKEVLKIDFSQTTNDEKFTLEATSCLGMCDEAPAIMIDDRMYGRLTPGRIEKILARVAKSGVGKRLTKPLNVIASGPLLKNVGRIDPECICDYLIAGGYNGLKKALKMPPAEVVEEMKRSDLRGRGGAGFPVGMKWEFTAKASGPEKYVVCNADEGEPGTFKDRVLMEYDPHKVIEGLIIACYAIGASRGLIYIRGEYVLAATRLEMAIEEAKVWGVLGKRIWGADFSCDLEVVRGAGAYVVGEETALLESIEGKRGEPRAKPPYPAERGLFGKPTAVNNVETLANIPAIILNGAEWYRSLGDGGTKLLSLSGDLKKKGVAEIPLGKMKLSEIINDLGGGVDGSDGVKAIILSGVSGSLVTPDKFEMVLDARAAGCGSIIVLNQTRNIVDAVKNIMHFFVHESCGRCIPCSRGGKEIYDIVCRITGGSGKPGDLELLEELGKNMRLSSFCPLGQSAGNILLASLEKFRNEWLSLIEAVWAGE